MNKKYLVISGIFIVIATSAFFLYREKTDLPSENKESRIILFYSVNCVHCQNVEAFLEANKVASKVSFESKQLDDNSANFLDLRNKALACGLKGDIGIPFLWNGESNECFIGDTDVINFFKNKLK